MKKRRWASWKVGDVGIVKENLYYLDPSDVPETDPEFFVTKDELLKLAGLAHLAGTPFVYIIDADTGEKCFQSMVDDWRIMNPAFKYRLTKIKR